MAVVAVVVESVMLLLLVENDVSLSFWSLSPKMDDAVASLVTVRDGIDACCCCCCCCCRSFFLELPNLLVVAFNIFYFEIVLKVPKCVLG